MHQLWKHPNGVYYALHGPRLRLRTSLRTKDREEADRQFNQFVAEHSGTAPASPTLGVILEGYRASRSSEIRSPNALKFAVQALRPALGTLRPEHLVPATVKRYAAERGAGDGTILREVGVLRAALKWALQNRWIAVVPKISNPVKTPRGRGRWLTRDEAKALLAACRLPHLRLFVLLGLMTGARSAAILELTWERVDLKGRLIDFGEGHGNKRRAIVPINAELMKALLAAQEASCGPFVIEQHAKSIRTVKNGFKAACGRAGVEGVTPHILRHTCATWQVAAGVPYAVVGKMLGDTAKTIEDRYGHHSPKFLRAASDALQFSAGLD